MAKTKDDSKSVVPNWYPNCYLNSFFMWKKNLFNAAKTHPKNYVQLVLWIPGCQCLAICGWLLAYSNQFFLGMKSSLRKLWKPPLLPPKSWHVHKGISRDCKKNLQQSDHASKHFFFRSVQPQNIERRWLAYVSFSNGFPSALGP